MPPQEHVTPEDLHLNQLRRMLEGDVLLGPDPPHIDICGVIIEYLSRTGISLHDVFMMNPEIYKRLFTREKARSSAENLVRWLVSTGQGEELITECENIFPLVSVMTAGMRQPGDEEQEGASAPDTAAMDRFRALREAGHHLIWQLSDIHFGDFNALENDPSELAAFFGLLVADQPSTVPDIIVFSGDVTSRTNPDEFGAFSEFALELSQKVWANHRPERLLLVPGNHDTLWLPRGTTDRLELFRQYFGDSSVCITPFGPEAETVGDAEILRAGAAAEDCPPLAVVRYDDLRLEFVLLVSAYHSGALPPELVSLLENIPDDARDELMGHLRTDRGWTSRNYIEMIARKLHPTQDIRLAVLHHHLCNYGANYCANDNAALLLKTLWRHDTPIALHGHIHMSQSDIPRPPIPGHAYCVPCGTLSSHPDHGDRGFSLHLLSPTSSPVGRALASFWWNLGELRDFDEAGLTETNSVQMVPHPIPSS